MRLASRRIVPNCCGDVCVKALVSIPSDDTSFAGLFRVQPVPHECVSECLEPAPSQKISPANRTQTIPVEARDCVPWKPPCNPIAAPVGDAGVPCLESMF